MAVEGWRWRCPHDSRRAAGRWGPRTLRGEEPEHADQTGKDECLILRSRGATRVRRAMKQGTCKRKLSAVLLCSGGSEWCPTRRGPD